MMANPAAQRFVDGPRRAPPGCVTPWNKLTTDEIDRFVDDAGLFDFDVHQNAPGMGWGEKWG